MARPTRPATRCRSLVWLGSALAAVFLARPAAVHAAVDASGEWYVDYQLLGGTVPAHLTAVQSGTDLTMVLTLGVPTGFPVTSVGTIDPDTGAFSVATTDFPGGTLITEGTVGADSYTFSATTLEMGEPRGTLAGSRCANGVLDATEQCDDGNRSNGDCCSSACQFRASGAGCAQDGIQCTDAICDGAGTCTHPFSAPGTGCNADDEFCTVDTCDGAGGCSVTGAMPAGIPCASPTGDYFCAANACDGSGVCQATPQNEGAACETDSSVCTIDQCVAGVCTTVGAPDCGTCEICDDDDGCVARRQLSCVTHGARSALQLVDAPGTADDAIVWKRAAGPVPPFGDLGAATAAHGAHVCVIDATESQVLARADFPAGSSWVGRPARAAFRESAASGGARAKLAGAQTNPTSARLAASAKATGARAEVLGLPPPTSGVVVELHYGDGSCVGSGFDQLARRRSIASGVSLRER